jgi:hypothetical protein
VHYISQYTRHTGNIVRAKTSFDLRDQALHAYKATDRIKSFVVIGRFSLHTKSWLENLKGRDHLQDLNAGKRMILKGILNK